MIPFLRLSIICVNLYTFFPLVIGDNTFIELDISNPGQNFHKFQHTNHDRLLLNENLVSEGKILGKVTDQSTLIIEAPDSKSTHRFVKLIKIPSSNNYNPELEDFVKNPSSAHSQTVGSDHEKLVEVHTFFQKNLLVDRFRKNSDGKYERFDYELLELDICRGNFNKIDIENHTYVSLDNYKTIGSIKCNGVIVLDSMNVFYRVVMVKDSSFVVFTLPRFGIMNKVTYDLHPSREYVLTQRSTRHLISLKIGESHLSYMKLVTNCGVDCSFYDGCNNTCTIMDVLDGNNYIYKNRKTYCLSVKVEDVRGVNYLTIYDRERNSDLTYVKIFKKTQNAGYINHEKTLIDMDISDLSSPKPKDNSYKHLTEMLKVHENMRTRIFDIEYRIGKIYYGDELVLGEGENVLNRELYSDSEAVLVHDELYDGTFKRYLLKPNKRSNNDEDSEESKVKLPKVSSEDAIKVDLHLVKSEKVVKFLTDSQTNLFIRPKSFSEKLGTLTYNENMFCPNKIFVSRQYLIMGENDMLMHSLTKKGFSFFESYSLTHSLMEDDTLFLANSKNLLNLDVCLFYEALLVGRLCDFDDFDINNMGDYYYIGVSYKKLYTDLIGHVSCQGYVFEPMDNDLNSRFVILPKNTQSFVIIKDCDPSDCWFKMYTQVSQNGRIKFEIQSKKQVDLDLSKLFENNEYINPSNTIFKLDDFTVYQYGSFSVRITDELTHRIGKVMYKNKVLAEDDPNVYTRMVNMSLNKDKGLFRVLDIERWDKSTKSFKYQLQENEFKVVEKEKVEFALDLEPVSRENPMLNITQRGNTLNYYLNWICRDDYKMTKILYSEYDSSSDQLISTTIKDNLQDFPVFVRLHKKEPVEDTVIENEFVVAVENHNDHEKPNKTEFFEYKKNANKKGFIFKFNMDNKQSQNLNEYSRDMFHRRNFTSHRHKFHETESTT